MNIRILIVLLSLLLPQSVTAQIIKIAGSTTVKAFMEPAVEAYRKLHPEIRIDVQGGGSGVGAAEFIAGSVHLGMVSRELTAQEKLAIPAEQRIQIGSDAVAVVVSDELFHQWRLHALKKEDITAIYRGEINNWREFGGPDRRILVIDKEKQRGTRQVFAEFILGDGRAVATQQSVVVGPNRHVEVLLTASDQAIGFLSFAELDEHMHGLEIIVDGKSFIPSVDAVSTGSYPLSRSLYILLSDEAPVYVKEFVTFLRSAQAEVILRETGFLPVK